MPAAPPAEFGDSVDFGTQHVVELKSAGPRATAGVVDDQMIDLQRILGIGKVVSADDHGIAVAIGIDEQCPLLVEIEASLWRNRGTAGALDLEHRLRGDRLAVEDGAHRNHPKAGVRPGSVVDNQRAGQFERAVGKKQRLVGCKRCGERPVDRRGIVGCTVAGGAIAAHIDPRRGGAGRCADCRRARSGNPGMNRLCSGHTEHNKNDLHNTRLPGHGCFLSGQGRPDGGSQSGRLAVVYPNCDGYNAGSNHCRQIFSL